MSAYKKKTSVKPTAMVGITTLPKDGARGQPPMQVGRAMAMKIDLTNQVCDFLGVKRINRGVSSLNRYELHLVMEALKALKQGR